MMAITRFLLYTIQFLSNFWLSQWGTISKLLLSLPYRQMCVFTIKDNIPRLWKGFILGSFLQFLQAKIWTTPKCFLLYFLSKTLLPNWLFYLCCWMILCSLNKDLCWPVLPGNQLSSSVSQIPDDFYIIVLQYQHCQIWRYFSRIYWRSKDQISF